MTDYVKGVDVSQWQGSNFPFDQAYADGYRFALIRAAVRVSTDPEYVQNVTRAREAGLLTGSYFYIYQATNPEEQARGFVKALKQGQGALDYWGPWLDVEENDLTWEQIDRFWVEFHKHWSNQCIGWRQQGYPDGNNLAVYTSQSKWNAVSGKPANLVMACPLWVADWGEGRTSPRLPTGWDKWLFWQWTSKGQISGHSGNVDLNHGDYVLEAPPEKPPERDSAENPLLRADFHLGMSLWHLEKAKVLMTDYTGGGA